jgi:hypothetical protein
MSKILGFAVLLLSVMLMTVGLFLTQILQATHFSGTFEDKSQEEMEKMHMLYEYFGSFTRCLLSMFELTLANWAPVTRLLAEEVAEPFWFLCVVHKLIIGFAVIGVINGVILQETFSVALTDDMIMMRKKKRASEVLSKKMTTLFDYLDAGDGLNSGDGLLDFEEFEKLADLPEVQMWLASMDIETDDLRTLFNLLDDEKSGAISVDQLVDRIGRVKGAARSIDVLSLYQDVHHWMQLSLQMDDSDRPSVLGPRGGSMTNSVQSSSSGVSDDVTVGDRSGAVAVGDQAASIPSYRDAGLSQIKVGDMDRRASQHREISCVDTPVVGFSGINVPEVHSRSRSLD